MMKVFWGALIFCSILCSTQSHAALRTIRFFATGDNAVTHGKYPKPPTSGPSNAIISTCKISISNQSGVSQKYTLKLDTTNSKATWVGNTPPTSTGTGAVSLASTVPASKSNNTEYTLNDLESHHYTFTYPQIPYDPTEGSPYVIGTQSLVCVGTVDFNDTANPGSVGFSGILTTYTEEEQYSSNFTTPILPIASTPIPSFVPLTTQQL